MRFVPGSLHRIKSISQRSLALYWDRLHNGTQLPPLDAFTPDARMHEPKQLAIWQVEERAGEPRTFRAAHLGGFIAEAAGTTWERRTLDEIAPPKLLPLFRDASDACAATGCAIYSILRTCNGENQTIDLERLLLPFGTANRVGQLVASLQLVSMDTQPARRGARAQFERDVTEVLAIRIAPSVKKAS